MDEEVIETTEDEAVNEGGEEENSEALEQEVEYELDEDGEPVTDDDGDPVPKQVAEGEEETERQPDHKKGAQERIQQLANEKRELADRLERLEAQFSKSQAEKPDFVDIDMNRVNEYLQTTGDQIDELKLEGRYFEAKKLETVVAKLILDIDENDKKRTEYGEKQNVIIAAETAQRKRMEKLDNDANEYRDRKGISPDMG